MASKNIPQTASEKDFEQRLDYTRIALGLIEKEYARTDLNSIRLVVMIWDRIRAVGGDFSLKDAVSIKRKVEQAQAQPETHITQTFGQELSDYAEQS